MKKILNNKILKIVYNIIKFIVVGALILYVLFLAVQRFTNNSSVGGYRVFTIASGSMEPVYEMGDVLLVKEKSLDTLNVGDDITYIGEIGDFKDRIVTHRIIELNKEDDKIRTQGLANPEPDPVIKSNQILGKVTYKFVIISFLTKLTRNKIGFYFLIFVPLVLVIFLEVVDIVTQLKEESDDNEDKDK